MFEENSQPSNFRGLLILLGIIIVFLFVVISFAILFEKFSNPETKKESTSLVSPNPTNTPKVYQPPTKTPTKAELLPDRKRFIVAKEREMLDKGFDFYLSLKGKEQEHLQIKYVLMSRPSVHQLANNEDFLSTLRSLGFTKIICTDGHNDTWTIPLDN